MLHQIIKGTAPKAQQHVKGATEKGMFWF